MAEIGRIRIADLPDGAMVQLRRPPFHVLVARVGDRFHALEDACPHSGLSLCRGELHGHVVRCAGHGWEIDVRDGRVLTEVGRGESNPTLRCEVEDGWVVVYD